MRFLGLAGPNRRRRPGQAGQAVADPDARKGQVMPYVIAFGRFWYDFLIGDRPELFFGPILALVLVAQLVGAGWTTTGGLVLFVLVVASGGVAVGRELAEARARSDG
jgi:hypothetical protein